MKFKIDQNLPIEAADLLTAAGHSEKLLAGHPDAMTVYQQSSTWNSRSDSFASSLASGRGLRRGKRAWQVSSSGKASLLCTLGGVSDERIVDVCKDEDHILIISDLDSNLEPLAV